jgi:hypothetical protein
MGIESFSTTGLYDGYVLSELRDRCLWRLKQNSGNYDKYSVESIDAALNDTIIEVATRLKCIQSFAIVELKAGYRQYKPPASFLSLKKAFFYKSATSYYELFQKNSDWLDLHRPGWRTTNGDPQFIYPGDSYGNIRKLGFYPTPDTDGDSYILSPDTGIFASSTGLTTTGNITGTAANDHATILTDFASRTFSALGVKVGMMAVNVTDGSSGQISAVSGSTIACTLAGGSDNSWDAGDSFAILAGEYGVVTSWENDEQYLFSGDVGGMVDVNSIVNNVYIEFYRRPLKLQYPDQYPEVPSEVHPYLADNVCWLLKRTASRGSDDYVEATVGREAFIQGLGTYADPDKSVEDDCFVECSL